MLVFLVWHYKFSDLYFIHVQHRQKACRMTFFRFFSVRKIFVYNEKWQKLPRAFQCNEFNLLYDWQFARKIYFWWQNTQIQWTYTQFSIADYILQYELFHQHRPTCIATMLYAFCIYAHYFECQSQIRKIANFRTLFMK